MNIQETITELNRIDKLYEKIQEIGYDKRSRLEYKKEAIEDAESEQKLIHEAYEAEEAEKLKGIISDLPLHFLTGASPVSNVATRKDLSVGEITCAAISLISIYLTVFSLVFSIYYCSDSVKGIDGIWTLGVFAVLLVVAIVTNKIFSFDKAFDTHETFSTYQKLVKTCGEYVELVRIKDEERYNAFKAFDKEYLASSERCLKDYRECDSRRKQAVREIKAEYLEEQNELKQQEDEVRKELATTTLLPEELYAYAGLISSMLRQKRADSLKEAINLALEEKRKEDEEAARREEADRREAILQKQASTMKRMAEEEARATREHNAAMERAARAQAAAAQAQAEEAKKQTELANRQARDAERGAHARCVTCANNRSCGAKYGAGAVGCSSYRPK